LQTRFASLQLIPWKTRRKLLAGEALLVCAYGSDEQFQTMQLEGAIALGEFLQRLPQLARTQEVVFYCA